MLDDIVAAPAAGLAIVNGFGLTSSGGFALYGSL